MKNIRSISIVALPLMLLLSTVNVNAIIPTAVDGEMLEGIAAHNAPTVKGRVDAAKDLALAHPYISAAVAAAALGAGYISYKMITKKATPATDFARDMSDLQRLCGQINAHFAKGTALDLDATIDMINAIAANQSKALKAAISTFVSSAKAYALDKNKAAKEAYNEAILALVNVIKAQNQSFISKVWSKFPSKKFVVPATAVLAVAGAGYAAYENSFNFESVKSGIKSISSKVSNWFSKSAKKA